MGNVIVKLLVAIGIAAMWISTCPRAKLDANEPLRHAAADQGKADGVQSRVLFQEQFDKGQLAEGWTWVREHEGFWRLKDGALDIRVEPGKANNVKNALLREAPDRRQGRYAVEVTVSNATVPTQLYEQAGITWYSGGKPVFKLVKELVHGQLMIIPGRKPMEDKSVRLRLIVTEDSWTAQYQPSAKGPFLDAASGKLPAPSNDQVSVQCYNGPPDAEHWIRFDDFRILRME